MGSRLKANANGVFTALAPFPFRVHKLQALADLFQKFCRR
jgi:hypothetical protein